MADIKQAQLVGLVNWLVARLPAAVSILLRGSSVCRASEVYPPWDIDIVVVTDVAAITIGDAAKLASEVTDALLLPIPVDLLVVNRAALFRSETHVHTRILLNHGSMHLWGEDLMADLPQQTLDPINARHVGLELLRTVDIKMRLLETRLTDESLSVQEFSGRAKSLSKAALRLACIESMSQHARYIRTPSECMRIWQARGAGSVSKSSQYVFEALSGVEMDVIRPLLTAIRQMKRHAQGFVLL